MAGNGGAVRRIGEAGVKPAHLHLAEARQARDAARATFDANLAQVKDDLAARGVGGRVADRLGEDARTVLGEALDIAGESKGVIAGTVAMLALWFLRQPIIAWVAGMIQDDDADAAYDGAGTGKHKENHR